KGIHTFFGDIETSFFVFPVSSLLSRQPEQPALDSGNEDLLLCNPFQVEFSQPPCAVSARIKFLDQILIRIANAFDLFAFQSERLCNNRICSGFGDEKIGDDGFLLSIASDSPDTLFVDPGTPVQFAKYYRTCNFLQTIEARARPQRQNQNVAVSFEKRVF